MSFFKSIILIIFITISNDNSKGKALINISTILNNAWIINFACFNNVTFDARQIKNLKPFS